MDGVHPLIAFECVTVLPPSVMAFFLSFSTSHFLHSNVNRSQKGFVHSEKTNQVGPIVHDCNVHLGGYGCHHGVGGRRIYLDIELLRFSDGGIQQVFCANPTHFSRSWELR